MEVPPIVSEEKELSAYQRMMSDVLRKLENAGLKVTDIKVTFGKIPDRILMLEKELKPEIIVMDAKKSPVSKLFGKDPCEVLLKNQTPQ